MAIIIERLLDDYTKRTMDRFTLEEWKEAIELLQKRIDQLTNKDYRTWLTKSTEIWDCQPGPKMHYLQ
jgi:hypothetical protein